MGEIFSGSNRATVLRCCAFCPSHSLRRATIGADTNIQYPEPQLEQIRSADEETARARLVSQSAHKRIRFSSYLPRLMSLRLIFESLPNLSHVGLLILFIRVASTGYSIFCTNPGDEARLQTALGTTKGCAVASGSVTRALKPLGRLLLAEPTGHVKLADFEDELRHAASAGLDLVDRPTIRRSNTALLEKTSQKSLSGKKSKKSVASSTSDLQ